MNLTDFIDLEDPKPELVLLPPDFLAAHTYWDEDVQRRPKPGLIRSIRKALETGSVDYNKIRPAELTYRKEKALVVFLEQMEIIELKRLLKQIVLCGVLFIKTEH